MRITSLIKVLDIAFLLAYQTLKKRQALALSSSLTGINVEEPTYSLTLKKL